MWCADDCFVGSSLARLCDVVLLGGGVGDAQVLTPVGMLFLHPTVLKHAST